MVIVTTTDGPFFQIIFVHHYESGRDFSTVGVEDTGASSTVCVV